MTFQPQPLRSHALYILIKFVDFFVEPRALRFRLVAAAQLFKRLLYREFGCFSHADPTSSFLTMELRAPPLKFALIKIKPTERKKLRVAEEAASQVLLKKGTGSMVGSAAAIYLFFR
jgi:hypothetical protein